MTDYLNEKIAAAERAGYEKGSKDAVGEAEAVAAVGPVAVEHMQREAEYRAALATGRAEMVQLETAHVEAMRRYDADEARRLADRALALRTRLHALTLGH